MRTLLSDFQKSGTELGIEVKGPLDIILPSGAVFRAEILVCDIGARLGTIIDTSSTITANLREELKRAGYTISTISELTENEPAYNVDVFVQLYRDWGWCSKTKEAPSWFDDGPSRNSPACGGWH